MAVSAIAERLAAVRERVASACRTAGRSPESVRLVAVSKFHPESALREAYAAGQRDFGESYAQELSEKARSLADLSALRFHFVGGLQRNKLKLLVPLGGTLHTLASSAAARTLEQLSLRHGVTTDVMIQVNVSGEPQKSGVTASEVENLVAEVRALSRVRLRGFMAIPRASDTKGARAGYGLLRRLAQEHALPELSMGMSGDLELAIAEGSTCVRVGQAIFGPRPVRA